MNWPDFLNCLFACGHYLALPSLLTLLADFAYETGIHVQAPFSNILAETCVLFSNSLAWLLILDGPDFLNCLFSCGHYLALPCLLTLLADFAFETGIHDNKGVWRARQLIPLFQLPPPSFQLRWCLVQWLHIEPIVEIVFWMIITSVQSSYASRIQKNKTKLLPSLKTYS